MCINRNKAENVLSLKVHKLKAVEESKELGPCLNTEKAIRKKMKALKLLTHFYCNFLKNHARNFKRKL